MFRKKLFAFSFALFAGVSFVQIAQADPYEGAILQGLDKVTARVSKLHAPVGQYIKFGNLEIIVRTCDKKPPTEAPESTAFLEVSEVKPGEDPVEIFKGWMFASSPALNSMEHPVYDLWVLDCENISSISENNNSAGGSE